MKIRPVQEADEAQVAALYRQVFGYSTPHNDPKLVIRRKLARQRELFFVAESEGTLVGTIMCGYDGHRGWLYSLAVDPGFRLRGIGRDLVRHAESSLRALGCVKINLQVLVVNAGVTQFYEKLGYRVEERISMGKIL
jgi:ribosomal protein S18 acetylase RimI-like enzyme